MDTLSHAIWGRLVLDGRPRRLALAGAVAGAAPDLLFFVPSKIEQMVELGWAGLMLGRGDVWRADGPPLPPELVEAYWRYYVWSHSLVVLGAVVGLGWLLLGRQHRPWLLLAIPYALHILMDIPTHERYLTRPLHPMSAWEFSGLSWSDPRIFFPHLVILLAVIAWRWRIHRRAARDPAARRDAGA